MKALMKVFLEMQLLDTKDLTICQNLQKGKLMRSVNFRNEHKGEYEIFCGCY
jgi:hypothetical protein